MKLLLTGAILLTFTINAQNNPPLKNKLNEQYSSFLSQNRKNNGLEKTIKPVYDSIVNFSKDSLIDAWGYQNRVIDLVYNSNKDLVSSLNLSWNGTSWDSSRISNSYDINYNLINYLLQAYNLGSWENVSQINNTYDVNNNILNTVNQNWNGSSWENVSQISYTYDGNNNVLYQASQNWSGSSWLNYLNYTATFDVNNNPLTYTHQSSSNGVSWENEYIYSMSYNEDNLDTATLFQVWDGTSWFNSSYETYSYNSNGLVDIYKNYGYDVNGIDTFLVQHALYTYDLSNNLTFGLGQWANEDGSFTNSEQESFVYDVNNNLIYSFYEYYLDDEWRPGQEETSTYNSDNVKESAVSLYWMGGTLSNIDSTHYYIQSTTSIYEVAVESNLSSIYPNPANEKFTVYSKNIPDYIEIFTLTGTSIYRKDTVANISEIDASRLEKGIYLVQINSGLRKESVRITIQ